MSAPKILGLISQRLEIGESIESLRRRIEKEFGLAPEEILSFRIVRRSLDARKKRDIHYRLSVEVSLDDGEKARRLLEAGKVSLPKKRERDSADWGILEGLRRGAKPLRHRPVVLGSGPGGLFAAWLLAREGYQPLILDRGPAVPERVRALRRFEREGFHDPENNILFGEGGAGTFSDGKLTSRSRSPLVGLIHQIFLEAGSPEDIAVDAKPHIGTDRLRAALVFLRRKIESMGAEFAFKTRLEDLELGDGGELHGLKLTGAAREACEALLLAPGHSARDLFASLHARKVSLEFKPFQLGLRIEHPQEMIDRSQFGNLAAMLPPAEYVLNDRARGIFSFCMCPGGQVVASISEAGHLCTNGMSRRARSSPWANSALMMTLSNLPEAADHPLGGIEVQRHLERRGFEMGGGDYSLPAQRAGDFIRQRPSRGRLEGSYARDLKPGNLVELLPPGMGKALSEALEVFDRRIPGFIAEGILVGPETRGSSPIRIVRDQLSRESVSTPGLYPVGEGAGAAGGIISSAIDGLRSAAALIGKFERP